MTSGSFTTLPLDRIFINREGRQRRALDPAYIRELADSINRLGLIHPPVITRAGELVSGECRIAAAKVLGWDSISIQFVDELDERTLRAIELEENVKRKALPWQDECLAVHEYHNLRLADEPTWSGTDTAKALGMSQGGVSEKLRVAEEFAKGNAHVIASPRYSTAKNIVKRSDERKVQAATAALSEAISPGSKDPESILTADFNEWAKTYTGPKFNFIHCDFPYGIGADKFNQGAAPTHGGYDDSEDTYWTLLDSLLINLDRVSAPSCHFMFWFSMHFYNPTHERFAASGIELDPFPLIWTKSDNIGILPDPQRGPRRIYETALFGSRGDRKIVGSVSNAVAFPSQRDIHMSVKPQGMLSQFFRMFVDGSTSILDPTCGSGGALQAAESLGARHAIGLERDPEFAERARLALKLSRQQRRNGNEEGEKEVHEEGEA